MTKNTPAPRPPSIINAAVCTQCGCLCDDIELSIDGDRIARATRACEMGTAWFLRDRSNDGPVATIAGQEVTLDEAIEAAAHLLASARYPLIYGLTSASCEAQQRAVSLADWIGGSIDTTTSVAHGPTATAFSGVGEVTCTLGEVRHRGDLVIFWGTDPATSHPRHLERYSLDPPGMFVPRGREDRTCVVVDVRRSETAAQADLFLPIKPGRDFEALWVLRALSKGIALDADRVEEETGVSLAIWQDLMDRMKRARFGVILYGRGLATSRGGYLNGEAVLALTRDMNIFNRFVCLPMRREGNVAGGENVLLWATGYPFGVNLSRGYPRYGPEEFTAGALLARGEADVALIVGRRSLEGLTEQARNHLAAIPTIVIEAEEASSLSAQVSVRTSPPGISDAGTMYRMDDVPLPLRPTIASRLPSEVDVLGRLEDRVKALRGFGEVPVARERARLV